MMPSPNRIHHVVSVMTSVHEGDEDCELTVRSNGVVFYIRLSPSNFHNSPAITAQYLLVLELLHSGEEELNGLYEDEAHAWILHPFESLFAELAPNPAPTETLQDCLFPEFFIFALEAVDEQLVPRCLEKKDLNRMPPGARMAPKFLSRLDTLVLSFHPSNIAVRFDNLGDALYKPPGKVLLEDGQTKFFKAFSPGAPHTAMTELKAHMKIIKADLKPSLRVCRLRGVVKSEIGSILGMLITYIDHRPGSLREAARKPNTPTSLKQQWANQVVETLSALHEADVIWGDVKADNVSIDKEDNAWILDFGGGYTLGLVDAQNAGTLEGDLQGQAKLLEFLT